MNERQPINVGDDITDANRTKTNDTPTSERGSRNKVDVFGKIHDVGRPFVDNVIVTDSSGHVNRSFDATRTRTVLILNQVPPANWATKP